MRLVDILARELKVWPDQYYQIYQDSGGNLIGTLSDNDLEDCDSEDLPYDPVTIAWDGSSAIVERSEWQAEVDALYPKLSVPEEWSGEGLPPVGTECEFIKHNSPPAPKGQWETGKILYLSECTIVIGVEGGERVHHPRNCSYRPIRKSEQIAAEEREGAVHETVDHLKRWNNVHELCGMLHDAGYRKQADK